LFVAGGAAIVVASFLLVVPRSVAAVGIVDLPIAVPPARRPTLALPTLAVGVLAFLIVGGIIGNQDVAENLLPVAFWLVAWIVVPMTCGTVGDWTTTLNPFAALARLGDRASARRWVLGSTDPVAWPRRLGYWPAVLAFFAGGCGELVFNASATVPHVLALGMIAYGMICVTGGLLFGPSWLTYGELFSVLYATWGRLGYWRFGAPGRRGFAGGLETPFEPTTSRLTFVVLLLASVNFDGLLATPSWVSFEQRLPGQLVMTPWRLQVFRVGTFAVLTVVVLVVFGTFAVLSVRTGGPAGSKGQALAGLLPSVVPIAFGYLLAHNIEYLAINLQLLFPLLGNPAGVSGWPRFPYPFNDSYPIHLHALPSGFYWYFSISVVVAVHVVAVILAHRHLARGRADHSRVRRGEFPWLVAMVGYTMFSLWLIAQPLAKGG
jgi:hypothetical protein